MTPHQRMTAFLAAVADLCDKHGIEISSECGCKIGFCTAEDATFAAADVVPFASCAEIRNAEVYPKNVNVLASADEKTTPKETTL